MIASRIRELREALGLSMPAFGKKLGCSRDVIANIEYGRSEPKEVFLSHLCDIYGVNRQWLLEGIEPMLDEKAGDEKVQEAAELFRTLSPELRELALSQLKSLKKLMDKKDALQTGSVNNDVDTIRLMAAMLNAQEFDSVKAGAGEVSGIGRRIGELMEQKNLTFRQLLKASALDEKELYRILDSSGVLRRDALISVCVALSLEIDEAQRLLTSAGQPSLYAKNRRDAACIFALMKGIDLQELNQLLRGLEESPL